jgi:hypothetical protein
MNFPLIEEVRNNVESLSPEEGIAFLEEIIYSVIKEQLSVQILQELIEYSEDYGDRKGFYVSYDAEIAAYGSEEAFLFVMERTNGDPQLYFYTMLRASLEESMERLEVVISWLLSVIELEDVLEQYLLGVENFGDDGYSEGIVVIILLQRTGEPLEFLSPEPGSTASS